MPHLRLPMQRPMECAATSCGRTADRSGTNCTAVATMALGFLLVIRSGHAAPPSPLVTQARALSANAMKSGKTGKPQEAVALLERAARLFQRAGDRADEGLTFYQLGTINQHLSRPQAAISNYRRALPLVQAAGKKQLLAEILFGLSSAYLQAREYRQAIASANQGLAGARAAGDRTREGEFLYNTAIGLESMDSYGEALSRFRKALPLSKLTSVRREDPSLQGNVLLGIGRVLAATGHTDQALQTYKDAAESLHDAGNLEWEAAAWMQLANLASAPAGIPAGQPGDTAASLHLALDAYRKALALWRQDHNRLWEAFALVTLENRAPAPDAQEYRRQADDVLRTLDPRHRLEVLLFRAESKPYDQAIPAYQQGLAMEEQLGDRSGAEAVRQRLQALQQAHLHASPNTVTVPTTPQEPRKIVPGQ